MNNGKGFISKTNGNKLDRINKIDRMLFQERQRSEAANVIDLYYTKVYHTIK